MVRTEPGSVIRVGLVSSYIGTSSKLTVMFGLEEITWASQIDFDVLHHSNN